MPPGNDAWGACRQRCWQRWPSLGRRIARATGWRVWNPARYGEIWHAPFRASYPHGRNPVLLLGLNPGPYGMAQTGIPFTDIRRLSRYLPHLARQLQSQGGALQPPGLAPRSLRPYLKRTFESSSVRVFLFLERLAASAEQALREVVMVNPCPLLFMDGEGQNQTPAQLHRAARAAGHARAAALRDEANRLRLENTLDCLATFKPRGVVLLGRDLQKAMSRPLLKALDPGKILHWMHPARAVPLLWADGLLQEGVHRGWFNDSGTTRRRTPLHPASRSV